MLISMKLKDDDSIDGAFDKQRTKIMEILTNVLLEAMQFVKLIPNPLEYHSAELAETLEAIKDTYDRFNALVSLVRI
jgi:hypothetical protein